MLVQRVAPACHRVATPNTFCPFFVSLFSAAQHLAPADVCDSSCLLYWLGLVRISIIFIIRITDISVYLEFS